MGEQSESEHLGKIIQKKEKPKRKTSIKQFVQICQQKTASLVKKRDRVKNQKDPLKLEKLTNALSVLQFLFFDKRRN